MKSPVAFLGLGRMGLPMAARLLAAGYTVRAWNRSPAALDALAAEASQLPGSLVCCAQPGDAVTTAGLVITMLSDGPAVRTVVFGERQDAGLLARAAAGATLLDMSSIPPGMAREHAAWLAAAGYGAIDAPVSGGVAGARDGSLAIMAGGAAHVLACHADLLAVLGRVTHVGAAGAGQLAKLANQVIVGVTIGAVAEALLLAARGGADPAAVRAAIRGGFAESRILEVHGARMLDNQFIPGGAVHTQLKDLRTALAEARGLGLSLPITGLLESLFAAARLHGDGDLDHAGLLRELARQNGLSERAPLAPP